ncbi:YaaR family protein [Amphibacillus sediminis]|uniref:YaaR family protein n=1 Tax=Amphibacillus sediminis TaxID=360185 RepID=UPI000834182F|nr:YaaR family protein [Amphibacillus sediminis]
MKINKEIRAQIDTTKLNTQPLPTKGISFDEAVAIQAQKLQSTEIEQLLQGITAQGERLKRYRSIRELAKFKRLVKNFVKEAVGYGLDLSHSHSFTMDGGSRRLTIVKQIDEKLLTLTEAILEQEKRTVDLLGVIGEIKGLLINLYS